MLSSSSGSYHENKFNSLHTRVITALFSVLCIGAYFSSVSHHPTNAQENVEPMFNAIATRAVVSPSTATMSSRSVRRNAVTPKSYFNAGVTPKSYFNAGVSRSASTALRMSADESAAASSDRKFFVGGNWKCNGCAEELGELVDMLNTASLGAQTEVAICPPSVYIASIKQAIKPEIQVCSQDVSLNDKGAFTGDIAADMLVDLGIQQTLVGHSERRTIHKESSDETALKAKKALAKGVKVIACIGETLEEREADKTMDVVIDQLKPFAEKYETEDWSNTVLAYEPVWAIGTGKVATPEQAQEVHEQIRAWISENVGEDVAAQIRIIYGGSVNGGNAKEIGAKPDIDGFLVGGASLKPEFVDVINADPSNE